MSGQLTIKQSLNKAFRKIRPTRDEIDRLRSELSKMLTDANPNESEEYHKGLVKEFLIRNVFADHFINTKDRSDLVIHIGKNSASSVGVIIETKRPGNKAGMPTIDNLNKKAMQELLLYYLRERITNKNQDIKHLIITNLYEWFIFDAHEFVRFADDTKLSKQFVDFENGRLSSGKTDFFYKEIASPAIKKAKDKIKFTYFDIRDYENYLGKQSKIGDNKLIELQKVFSPTHLLKLPFANDSNTLNKDFYNELLHIIGLEEYKEKKKKLIRRKLKADRDNDSLLESAITQIASLGKLTRIKQIERFGSTEDERFYSVALELVITWINRILFLKLLESQIVSYHESKDFEFLNKERVPEYDDLNALFFQVLAIETSKRHSSIRDKFPRIPYLNSSLFEPTELEQEAIVISNLPDSTSLPLYKKTVLKRTGESINTLDYLFRFLDAYDFTSEGKEDVADHSRTLINASVLGLIFEKINGYKDGSFFTPGFITMYMCKKVIRRAVTQKFKAQTEFDSDSFEDLCNFTARKYKKEDLENYNEIVNSLKICDPAVGSGHFLVSALNDIIAVKAKLGILLDEKGLPLSNIEVDVENDELVVLDNQGEFFKYSLNDRASQRIQKTLFHEKQTIIENCLFGVDINPNSVKICHLRLWIELLKNAYYKEDGKLETLPNIDINIKCGNSLLSRYPLDSDLKDVLRKSKYSIEMYKRAVMTYRNAKNKAKKIDMEKLIGEIKGAFIEGVDSNHPARKSRAKLVISLTDLIDQRKLFQTESIKEKQKKVDRLTKSIAKVDAEIAELESGVIYRDAFEWRFEFPEVLGEDGKFNGFDIVVGNPPYGLFNKKQNQKIALLIQKEAIEAIKRNFPDAACGGINASRIFYNLALNLSSKDGYQTMIIPFGILTDKTSASLRKHIFYHHSFLSIDAFPERDNAKRRVFEDAKMSTSIILSCINRTTDKFNLGISYDRKIEYKNRFDVKYDDIIKFNPDLCPIPITNPEEYAVLSKIYAQNNLTNLRSISKCLTGEADMTFAKNAMTQNSKDALLIKGVQVDRFEVKHDPTLISQGEIEYLDVELFEKGYSGKKLKDAKKRRIVLQGLTGVNEKFRLKATIIDPPAFLANSCNYLIGNKTIPLNFVLGLVNSKVLNFVFKCNSTSSNVNGYEVDNLPIPRIIDEKVQKKIEDLIDQIFARKKTNPHTNTNKIESKIDQIIYELYNLDAEDVEVIKNSRN